MERQRLRRVVVIGSGGSGKTSFAAALAEVLGVPHVELDALYWGPNWTGLGGSPEGDARFRARIVEATAGGAWVADGNYSVARDLLWPQADAIVWLDYPLPLVMWRLLRRSLGRSLRRELLWGTNRENLRLLFFSRDSLLYYTPRTHHTRRRRFEQRLSQPDVAHVRLHRFRSPAEASAWLDSLNRHEPSSPCQCLPSPWHGEGQGVRSAPPPPQHSTSFPSLPNTASRSAGVIRPIVEGM